MTPTDDDGYPVRSVAAEAGYRITFHGFGRGRSDVLLVCFGGSPDGLLDFGFGAQWARKQGYDYVYVAQRRKSQYQDLPVEAFRDHLAPLCAGRRVFTYGISLGGYAALYYGGAIGARIIAVSPRNSLDPALLALRSERRGWIDYDQPWKHLPMAAVPRSPHRPLVILDPMNATDRIYLRRVIRPPYGVRMRILALPFAGHVLTRTLNEQGKLSRLLRAHIERDRLIDVISDTELWPPRKPRPALPDGPGATDGTAGVARRRPRPGAGRRRPPAAGPDGSSLRRGARRLRAALRRWWDRIAPPKKTPGRMPPPAGPAPGADRPLGGRARPGGKRRKGGKAGGPPSA